MTHFEHVLGESARTKVIRYDDDRGPLIALEITDGDVTIDVRVRTIEQVQQLREKIMRIENQLVEEEARLLTALMGEARCVESEERRHGIRRVEQGIRHRRENPGRRKSDNPRSEDE